MKFFWGIEDPAQGSPTVMPYSGAGQKSMDEAILQDASISHICYGKCLPSSHAKISMNGSHNGDQPWGRAI